jgi:hypothetical protein
MQNTSISQNEKNWKIVSLLEAISELVDPIDLDDLRESLISFEMLMKLIKESKENGFLEFQIMENFGLFDRILGYLGIPRKIKYSFSVTKKGYELLAKTVKKI